ncbi:GTP-binding protein [Gracilibacillus caseinilyticus]|uniref:GTP-binding protein n=1 Tax=Gracilibacillus caseinilyticus TaxID=2932256 RepID=A0ABY4EWJ0_9BACI|nr:GTP-binding protein [Gracilibacillus caseinilyticus]UOQ48788.1 GTP-binding protein [Gracilibacillus caseinilyticus]
MSKKIPVTVLSGFLGAGKTTLLYHLLKNQQGLKIAIVVNDMSEINIDAKLVNNGRFVRTKENLVEITNGCICCTLREDLVVELEKLAQLDIDYVLIESSGVSEPIPVTQSFIYHDEALGIDLNTFFQIDTMVTMVNGQQFWEDYQSEDLLIDRQLHVSDDDERGIVDLLIDQIEFANVIVLNKIDMLSDREVAKLTNVLHKLNPEAKIVPASFGQIDPLQVLHTNQFNFEKASQGAGWIKELNEEHTPETEEYGIRSFVYRSRKPFYPERFHQWLENWPTEIIRAKGFFWLVTRNEVAGLLSQAGSMVTLEGAGRWLASYSQEELAKLKVQDPALFEDWDEQAGDRMTEIVFIGSNMDKEGMIHSLNECLVTEEELETISFKDPLPSFT